MTAADRWRARTSGGGEAIEIADVQSTEEETDSMFRRHLRSIARRTRDWLSEDPSNSGWENEPTANGWLNAQHKVLLAKHDGERRPNYAWGTLHGLYLAAALKIPRVSVLEFGVAGGNGLVSLENIAEDAESLFGINVDVHGFDIGTGLPPPVDHRDSPNLFNASAFPMDDQKLRLRLTKAELHLGDVSVTVPQFIESAPPPVAFIAFDLDLYSSTIQALKTLEASTELLLPRVYCYFDDTLGMTHSDFTGERLAISEFNSRNEYRKISQIKGLRYFVLPQFANQWWVEAFYIAHIFDHELYNRPDGLVRADRMDLVKD
jgi:hypothetical protein